MEADKGRLFYATGIDNSQLRAGAAESRSILQSIGNTAKTEGAGIDAAFGKIAKAAGGFFALSQATDFAKKIIAVRGEIESLEISFETLLGNKEKAAAMFGEIRQFAVQTPMMLKDLASGAQTMLAFNIEAEKVMPMLKAIGDVSMGDAQKFNSLTLAFSQMSATGKLMGQDLLQMINAGFNPLSVISEKTGKSIGDLKEEMEKGKISAQMVADAFISATSAGGKFYGMLEKQSQGINGSISNLKGAIDDMYNDIGTASQGVVSGVINGATYLVKHYQEVAEILAVIVGTYGVYKGAVIANEAMIQAAATAKSEGVAAAYAAEMEALSALIPAKEAEAQTALQQAVAAGYITQEKANAIAALRAETQAQVEALATQEAAAKARMLAAQSDVRTSLEWQEEIEDNIKALEEEADALFESGDSIAFEAKQEEIAAAKAELLAIQKEQSAAAEAAETAVNEMNAASHQQSAIASAEDAAATNINTAATTTHTGATSALTIAKTKLIGVVRTLYATISAHPFALAAAAVAALAYGIYKLVTYETDAEKAQKRLNEAISECNGSWAAERLQIDVMFDRLRKAKEGTEDYEKAKDAILKQYGNYLDGLSSEISSLKDVEAAYKAVTAAANESARARAMDAFVKKEGDEYAKLYAERFDKMYNIIKKKKGQAFADAHRDDINDVISGKKNWRQSFISQFDEVRSVYMGQYAQPYIYTANDLKSLTGQARQGEADYTKLLQDARKRFGFTDEKKEEAPADTTPEVQNKKYWETQKKNAEAELAALTDIEAKGAKGQELRKKIQGYDKKLGLYSASTSAKAGDKAQDTAKGNADMLANEAAERRKQEEEYARQLADQQQDFEFEIRQARIDAMKDGIEKELAQNELNYDRLKTQNERRERDMLDSLADQQIRLEEDANPYLFKRKNKDGKWEEDPGKREERYREIRMALTVEDLDPSQIAQLEEFATIAAKANEEANKKSIENMLSEVLTYEQQRTKITEEYAKKREELYEKDEDGKIKTDAEGNKVLRKGVTQGNLDELDRQQTEALRAIDEQFAQREETYQAWCEEIGNLTLKQLNAVLEDAQKQLQELEKSGSKDEKALATARAKVATAQQAVNKANAKNSTSPGKRTIKEWEDLYKTLSDVEKEFESMGDTIGGTIGEIVSECGQFATSALTMINGIVQLTQMSATSIQGTAAAGATAISTMEKASVILTVISAALQIAMQIVNLFNDDEDKQKEIEHLQDRIDQLQWELDHQEIGRVQEQYGTAISRLNKALRESRAELASGEQGWRKWMVYFQKASDNQVLMQKTAEKLAKSYANMAYTADKALGEEKYKNANEQLENIAQQQILMQEQINAEASKKDSDSGAIQEWKNKIEELGQQALELINDMMEDIMGDTSTGIAEELADAFFEAFAAGEDAAEAWGKKVNEIVGDVVKRMLISKYLEEPLGAIFDEYKAKWFKDGKFVGINAVINSMQDFADDLNGTLSIFEEMMAVLPDEIKEYLKGDVDSTREASEKGIATASQDSVDELNGRATAIQGHTYSISENTKLLLANTSAILRSVMNIEQETDGFGARLERMEGNIKEMTSTLDDIATKGIRLKN